MQESSHNTQLNLFHELEPTLSLTVHFPQLATLERIGARPIDSIEELAQLWSNSITMCMTNCPYKKSKEYDKYRRKVVSGFIAWLFEYSCQDCGESNPTKILDCHHLDPEIKTDSVSRIVAKGKYIKAVEELLTCAYLCNVCHYKRHANLGDLDEDFTAINRRRHTYIQNLLGVSDAGTMG